MLTNVRGLIAELSFQTKNLKQAQEFQDRIENVRASMEGLAAMARKGAFAFAAFSAGVAKLTYDLGKNASEVDRNSLAVGSNVEEFQALAYAFERLDLEMNDMMDTLTQVSDRVLAASTGSKNYQNALKRLNLTTHELLAMDPAQALVKIADATRRIENPMERAALAASLLGEESARKLLPAMTAGGKALEDYVKQAKAAGVIMTREQIEKGKKVNDSYNQLRLILRVVRNEIALALSPVVIQLAKNLKDWFEANKDLIKQKIEDYADRVSAAFIRLKNNANELFDALGGLEGVAKLFERTAQAFTALLALKVSFYFVNLGLALKGLVVALGSAAGVGIGTLLASVTAVVVGVLAFIAVVEDLIATFQGADSITSTLIKQYDKLEGMALILADAWLLLADIVYFGYEMFQLAIEALKDAGPYLKFLRAGVLAVVAALALVVVALPTALAIIFFLFSMIVSVVSRIVTYLLRVVAAFIETVAQLVAFIIEAFVLVLEFLKFAAMNMIEIVSSPLKTLQEFVEGILYLIGQVADAAGNVLSGLDIGGAFDSAMEFVGIGGPSPAPAPVTAGVSANRAAGGVTNVQQAQTTTINVNGSSDPQATAREVSRRQNEVNDSWANSTYQQARQGNR